MRCTLGNGVYSAGFLSFGFVCCGEGGWRWKTAGGRCPCSCPAGVPASRGRDAPARMPLLRPLAPVAPDMGRDL